MILSVNNFNAILLLFNLWEMRLLRLNVKKIEKKNKLYEDFQAIFIKI